jgi:hypothetical protein
MFKDVRTLAPTCTITWSWSPTAKAWLVQAHSLRNGRSSLVVECWVVRSDPLPDDVIKRLLPALVDWWQADTLF